jgi:hypothetical protein
MWSFDLAMGRAAVAALDLDATAIDNHGARLVADHERRGLGYTLRVSGDPLLLPAPSTVRGLTGSLTANFGDLADRVSSSW